MTHHALERLSERFPDIDAESALTDINDALVSGEYRVVGQGVNGATIAECYLTGGTPVFPIIADDGAIKTVFAEGMEVSTTTEQVVLTPSFGEPDANGVRTVLKNQIVTEPGAYRMSMEHYHSQCCAGPSVSSTSIRAAENTSVWKFWSTFAGNPNAYPPKDNQDFAFGRAAHCLLLGDEVFAEGYAVLPFDSLRTKDAKEWKQSQIDAGKTVITKSDLETIERMAENLHKVPLVKAGILDGVPEVSLIWQDEITGLWVKARPDMIQLNGEVVADLKTCADASLISAHRSITKYAYDMQFALAIEGIERVFGVTATDAVVIFAEKTEPFHVRVTPIEEDTLYWARQRNRRGLDKIAAAIKEAPLPTFDDDETPYSLPPSMRERFAEQQREGGLPNV